MNKIFDINNPVWVFLGRIVDAVILHFLWFVCCIPIVTIGPATSALYYAMLKNVSDENPHYIKMFFKGFKENLRQGIPLGLIFLTVGAGLGYALYYYWTMIPNGGIWKIVFSIAVLMLIIYLFIFTYAFPLQARFVNTIGGTLKNAFFMSVKHMGWTFVMLFFTIAIYFVAFILNFVPILILGYGLVALINSYVLNHVFEPYIKAILGEEEDPDHWEVPEEGVTEEESVSAEETEVEGTETEEAVDTEEK